MKDGFLMRSPVPLESAQTAQHRVAASVLPASMMKTAHDVMEERARERASTTSSGDVRFMSLSGGPAVTAAAELSAIVAHSNAKPPKLVDFVTDEERELHAVCGGIEKWSASSVWSTKQKSHLGTLDDVEISDAQFGPMKRESAEHALVDELRAEYLAELQRLESRARAAASPQERLMFEADLPWARDRYEYLSRPDVDRILEQRFARKRHRLLIESFERAEREFHHAQQKERELSDSIHAAHFQETSRASRETNRREVALHDARAALERSRATLAEVSTFKY